MAEMLDECRRCVARLDEVNAIIANGGDDRLTPDAVHVKGAISKPTEAEAEYRMTVLAQNLRDLENERDELLEFIGRTGEVIEGISSALGNEFGYILTARYIDLWSWQRIAEDSELECGVHMSEQTCYKKRRIACEWVDSVGMAHARAGFGSAQI